MRNYNSEKGDRGDYVAPREMDPAALDELLRLLSDRRRRYILYLLCAAEKPLAIEEMVGWIVDKETDTGTVTDDTRERIRTTLYHNHLPTLNDAGFIDYDQRTRMAMVREPSDRLRTGLRLVAMLETPGEWDDALSETHHE